MENPEETLQVLEEWTTRRARSNGGSMGALPRQLDEYLAHVARTGDPVFQWVNVKPLIKEKLLSAVNDFHETSPGLDVPPAPNVEPFNYEAMRSFLLEKLDSFNAAPFTVQRLCELLTAPRKQYNRIDKFMRAVEKNVLVVSTRQPGQIRREEHESVERAVNGSDGNSDCGVDVDMEEASWREIRNSVIDPLGGPIQTVHPTEVPVNVTTVTPNDESRVTEEKMDETPELAQENKQTEVVENKEAEQKTEDTSMEVENSKETAEERSVIQERKSEEKNDVPSAAPPSSSEDDSNSNPETTPTEQQTEGEVENKSASVTSGEDSSSSNSSENTDGECATEDSIVTNSVDGDGDTKPTSEEHEVNSTDDVQPEKDDQPTLIQSENYTIADIQSTVPTEINTDEKSPAPVESEHSVQPDEAKPENVPEEIKTNPEETVETVQQKEEEQTV